MLNYFLSHQSLNARFLVLMPYYYKATNSSQLLKKIAISNEFVKKFPAFVSA
jgi:hypothetical protein